MAGDVTIETERLVLREFRRDDWEKVHEYAVDPEVYHYMPWGPNSEDETSAFVERARRGFEGGPLDPRTGLPAYVADSRTGQGLGSARGVGMSLMLIWAPELWPQTAEA